MQETELKFQVPAARSAALHRAVATASARATPLRAVYVDTPELHLARAGLALRLRQEGSNWVQTLKGRGDGFLQRLEHEVHLPPQAGTPQLDLKRHAGTPAATALAAALPAGVPLQPLYSTDIQRLHRRVRFEGAVIEIAHDQGALLAGGRRAQVDEIEFELVSGPAAALPALAQRWVERHGLWWDCRSKSERGTRLALQHGQVQAVQAADAPLAATANAASAASAARAWGATLQSGLAHALPNAAELASGQGGALHLQELCCAARALQRSLHAAPRGATQATALALAGEWQQLAGQFSAGAEAEAAAIATGRAFNTLLLRTLTLALAAALLDQSAAA